MKTLRENGDSQTLYITQEELHTLLDALSIFTKHENEVEMNNMLCELII